MNLSTYFRNKKVLITGHTGFKGSWLSIWLHEMGADVVGYALDPLTGRDNFVLCGLAEKVIDIRGDIRDFEKLERVFQKYEPEIVFHLAAQPIVRLSYEFPKETYDVNVGGTVNLLEMIRRTDSVKSAVFVTSDKCYQNKEWVWGYRESDPIGGYDPYSSSKGAAELIIEGYRNSFFNPDQFEEHGKAIASARAGNVIGGGDWAKDRIIPDCIRALESKETIKLRNPAATRPWQFVLEPLQGYLLLAARLLEDGQNYAGAWNFGPDYESIIPVEEVVKKVIHNWGYGGWTNLSLTKPLHEASKLSLDCTKAKTQLDWRPSLSVLKAIELTVDWYKQYRDVDTYNLCRTQIGQYEDVCSHQRDEDRPEQRVQKLFLNEVAAALEKE